MMFDVCFRSTRSASRSTCLTGSKSTTTRVRPSVNTAALCCGGSPSRGSNVRVRGWSFIISVVFNFTCWSRETGACTHSDCLTLLHVNAIDVTNLMLRALKKLLLFCLEAEVDWCCFWILPSMWQRSWSDTLTAGLTQLEVTVLSH